MPVPADRRPNHDRTVVSTSQWAYRAHKVSRQFTDETKCTIRAEAANSPGGRRGRTCKRDGGSSNETVNFFSGK